MMWSVGVETVASAQRAAKWGGVACLVQAARQELGVLATAGVSDKSAAHVIVYTIVATVLPLLLLIVGFRLWRHAGWIWGIVAAVVIAADLVDTLFEPAHAANTYKALVSVATSDVSRATNAAVMTAIVTKIVLLGLILNGVRGVLALPRSQRD